MKDGFIYRNPIFISEVKKRLADKRNYRLKTRLIAIDKFPSEKEEPKKNSFLISTKSSQSNFKHFLNFIKEKGYKSAFTKINDTIQNKKNKLFNKSRKTIRINNYLNNVIRIYTGENKDFFYKLNIRKYYFDNQRQTPFQIIHIKNNFLKQYIKFNKRRNSYSNLYNENNIKSYSINSSGQKIKIFGDNKNMVRNLSGNKSLNKNNVIKYRKSYLSKDSGFKKNFQTVKPNCYYNRLNLRKYYLKSKTSENIAKVDEN